jgi:hypothetical protein
MTPSIERLRAKRDIAEKFPLGVDPRVGAAGLSDEEFEELLDAVADAIPFRKPSQNQSLAMCLYAGCTRFDRWFAPSPYVVPREHRRRFARFVAALKMVELGNPTNCSVFEVHVIKDDLFHTFDGRSTGTIEVTTIDDIGQRLSKIQAPQNGEKLIEFLAQKAELESILDGFRDGSLQTQIKFDVPYILHRRRLDLTLSWNNMSVKMEIEPLFKPSDETFVNVVGAAVSVGASRWQSGRSKVTMSLSALVDGSAYTERLQAIGGHQFPLDGWPRSFTLAFELFCQVAWQLRVNYGGEQDWVPAPRDLSDLEFCIKTAAKGSFGQITKGSPACLIEVISPSKEPFAIDLGELKLLPWSVECRSRAKMYVELGDTNEALFWLNVGIEALITDRFNEIETRTGIVGLANELGSPKDYWHQAEEAVSKQFPEISGRVKWPSTGDHHVSIFRKLKLLYQKVQMKTSLDKLTNHYKVIASMRNGLFHGRTLGRVPVQTVTNALNAFDWVNENMWPSKG